MNLNLTPDLPTVEPCKILNLVVKRENGTYIHKQYLSVAAFNYSDLLEEIRQRDIIKSDEILHELGKMLIERRYVLPADTYMLDLGVAGRASDAVRELYRHKLNPNHSLVKHAVDELRRGHFDFVGPEGTLHVMGVENEHVAGHVNVSVADGSGLYETMKLDIIAPVDVDFPEDFKEQLVERFTEYLLDNHPEVEWRVTVHVSRSDLSLAQESRYARSRSTGIRYSPCDWLPGV